MPTSTNFMELGLDSLTLTQVALQLQKTFKTKVSFRQLMGECASIERLATMLEARLPARTEPDVAIAAAPTGMEAAITAEASATAAASVRSSPAAAPASPRAELLREVIEQQMRLMAQQLALLSKRSDPAIVTSATAGEQKSFEASAQTGMINGAVALTVD